MISLMQVLFIQLQYRYRYKIPTGDIASLMSDPAPFLVSDPDLDYIDQIRQHRNNKWITGSTGTGIRNRIRANL
jgi:hypothetical protein